MSKMTYDKEKQEFKFDEDVLAIFDSNKDDHELSEQVKQAISDQTVVVASGEIADQTVVVAPAAKELGSGLGGEAVIDRESWDAIIAQVDAQQTENENEEYVEDATTLNFDEPVAAGVPTEKMKKTRRKDTKKTNSKKPVKHPKLRIALLAFLGICVVGALAVGIVVASIIKNTPEINPDNIYDMLSESSVLLDNEGNTVANIYEGSSVRTIVDYSEIPQNLINAVVCTEDKTFWTHNGFNFIRIAGAVWDTVKSGFTKRIGGTSTITQQLARNIYLTDTRLDRGTSGIKRKIQEAYYTIIIERALSKEQIIEAYLNTVNLGFNSDGVQAASQAYFSKDVQDLSLIECATLAILPQAPTTYSPLKRVKVADVENPDDYDIVVKSDSYITYYNDNGEWRIELVLKNMVDQGKLDQSEADAVNIHDDLRAALNPSTNLGAAAESTTYFKDYIVEVVLKDLQKKLGYTASEAHDLLYKGGLVIHSTMNSTIQAIMDEQYADHDNFPKIGTAGISFDKKKNILYSTTDSSSGDQGGTASKRIMLYLKSNMFDENGVFTLTDKECKKQSDGSLLIYSGNRLNIYKTKVGDKIDYSLEFKYYYEWIEKQLYTTSGGFISIPTEYKDRDADGNLIIKADYFTATGEKGELLYADNFIFNDDGSVTISPSIYNLKTPIIQPQSAYVIMENETGKIVALVGGRDIEGSLLFNRANNPRQTGSSIKPLAIYSNLLQIGFDNAKKNAENGPDAEGNLLPVYTVATALDDIPQMYDTKLWPYNVTNTFIGATWLRHAIQQSLNCCAVRLYKETTPQQIISQLENFGITTIVSSGDPSDQNPAALALGGFTQGVSPIEMCAAYAAIGNYGVYNSPTCYTTITNKQGDVIISSETETHRVLDEEVASLTLDLLQSVVTEGQAKTAALSNQPTAGKTGTTSNSYDLWFCGLTPKYSATVWLGSDTNLYLSGTSSRSATKLWKSVMEPVGKLDDRGIFEMKGEAGFVRVDIDTLTGKLPTENTPEDCIKSEVFIKGTEPKDSNPDIRVDVLVCKETGYLATPECIEAGCAVTKHCIRRIDGMSWEALLAAASIDNMPIENKVKYFNVIEDSYHDVPDYYCPIHNSNPTLVGEDGGYIISPFAGLVEYDTRGIEELPVDDPENPDNPQEQDDTEQVNGD